MRLLLISNSTNPGEPYLDYPKHQIRDFLGDNPVTALFIPYAGVSISFDDYTKRVRDRFNEVGHDIVSVHQADDPVAAIENASAIVVGGGNTWQLIKMIREQQLIGPVREKVLSGTPYIGWSAGSNVACPTIKTTNDMPVVEPDGFGAFHLVNFQINPHYMDKNPDGHAGETREERINEFLIANPDVRVIGLREGCLFRIEGSDMQLVGPRSARIFSHGSDPVEMEPGADFSGFLD